MRHAVLRALTIGLLLAAGLGADPAPEKAEPKFVLTTDEKEMLRLINEARAEAKLPALKPSPILTRVARAHAANMAKQGKMVHVLDGKRPGQRVTEAGYVFQTVGENVAWSEAGADGAVPIAAIHKSLMDSKSHRDNILAAKYEEIGLGQAPAPKGQIYYCQVFATARKRR